MTKDEPLVPLGGLPVHDAAEFRSELRKFLQMTKVATTAVGLTPERYDLLLMVLACEHKGEPATVSSLSRDLYLGQTAVTELVKRSEAAGLIRKVGSETDARVAHIYTTDDGQARLVKAAGLMLVDREEMVEMFATISEQLSRPH